MSDIESNHSDSDVEESDHEEEYANIAKKKVILEKKPADKVDGVDDGSDSESDNDIDIDELGVEDIVKIDSESDEDDDDDDDDDEAGFDNVGAKVTSGSKNKPKLEKIQLDAVSDTEYDYASDDEDDDDDEDADYLKKIDDQMKQDLISQYHPEIHQHNYEEINALTHVVRNNQGIIVDPLHRTIPILTKYETARILGERAKQINAGAQPLVQLDNVIDGYLIARKELEEKKVPFIIKRPMPNGGCEYWKIKDLEILA